MEEKEQRRHAPPIGAGPNFHYRATLNDSCPLVPPGIATLHDSPHMTLVFRGLFHCVLTYEYL